MVSSIDQCKNCKHSCHCGNALDEFHKNLSNGFKESVE